MTEKGFPRILTDSFLSVGLKVGSAQAGFLALLLVFQGFGIISISTEYLRWVLVLNALNILSLPALRRLLFFRGSGLKCNYCGSKLMVPTGFLCTSCGAPVGSPKEVREMLGKKD